MLRFRVLGASFSRFGCSVFEFWVLRASVFVFECFVFETTLPEYHKQSSLSETMILGDLNARTGTLNDFIANDTQNLLTTTCAYTLGPSCSKVAWIALYTG